MRHGSPFWRKVGLAVVFFLLFLLCDGSSAASLEWAGAPTTYTPLGLTVVLLLYGRMQYTPLVLVSALVAALVNYHRPLLSWCGIPGVIGLYGCCFAGVALLRSRLRIDLRLGRLQDVGRYVLVLLGVEVVSATIGMLTLLGDGYIQRSAMVPAVIDWWASDSIAVLTIAPFFLMYVIPPLHRWLNDEPGVGFSNISSSFARIELLEITAQAFSVIVVIWLLFGCAPALPYQPLYLLFIPVIWVAVRRGVAGAAVAVFVINSGLTAATWITQAPRGSMPRLQLAMIALGLTGLCLGAVVSERKQGEEQLRRSEASLQEAQRVARLGSWNYNANTGDITWTDEIYRMLGFDPAQHPPRFEELESVFTRESWNKLVTEFYQALRSGTQYELELELVRPDGRQGWMLARGKPQRNARGEIVGVCGVAQDITKRKLAETKVVYLAYYDALTGLPNRSLVQDRLLQAIAAARRSSDMVAVLFLDLDRFKVINDTLGHATGDLLLQEVAERLRRNTREQDTVARVGGDEFLAVLNGVRDISDAAKAAERIVNTLTDTFMIQGRSLKVSCSLGISVFPQHGDECEILIKNADAAMYGAKESGRNRYHCFTEEMNAQVLERSSLEHRLRLTLERNELFLMYQPQVHIRSGQTIGLEALIRWRNPELGLVPPDKFIRVAESSGLILPIGQWVLDTACSQIRRWQDQGLLPFSVGVNVSAIQFQQEGFRERVHQVLQKTGIAPQHLELELTESVLTTNADVMFPLLQDLKEMGLKLAIDDFGTGYSSLSYLRKFPVSSRSTARSFAT